MNRDILNFHLFEFSSVILHSSRTSTTNGCLNWFISVLSYEICCPIISLPMNENITMHSIHWNLLQLTFSFILMTINFHLSMFRSNNEQVSLVLQSTVSKTQTIYLKSSWNIVVFVVTKDMLCAVIWKYQKHVNKMKSNFPWTWRNQCYWEKENTFSSAHI